MQTLLHQRFTKCREPIDYQTKPLHVRLQQSGDKSTEALLGRGRRRCLLSAPEVVSPPARNPTPLSSGVPENQALEQTRHRPVSCESPFSGCSMQPFCGYLSSVGGSGSGIQWLGASTSQSSHSRSCGDHASQRFPAIGPPCTVPLCRNHARTRSALCHPRTSVISSGNRSFTEIHRGIRSSKSSISACILRSSGVQSQFMGFWSQIGQYILLLPYAHRTSG